MTWFSRRRLYSDLSEEIRQHLEEKVEELVAGGMSRDAAMAAARREFGNVTLLEERSREVWRWGWLETLFADLRYAARQLRKSPAFTAAAVLTLALGIGANTAVFSVINAVVLRPLPFAHPERLVAVQSLDKRSGRGDSLSYPDFFDFRAGNDVFEHLVCYRDDQFTLTGAGQPLHLDGEMVAWSLFQLLGVQPALGRGFRPEEEKPGARVVVLSHQLWQSRFGGNRDIVGQAIVLDGQPYTVVGVAPAGFRFPVQNPSVQVWTTLARDATGKEGTPITEQRGARLLDAIARLKPGVSIEQSRERMDAIAGALAKQYPDSNSNRPRARVRPEIERILGDARYALLVLMGAVGLVLLIACANIANLLVARTAEREREFAVRSAIGASRPRVIRQLLTESLLLALLGAAGGVLLARFATEALLPFAGDAIPRIRQAGIDDRVLAFSTALALLTCVLFSLAPALQVAKTDLVTALKEGARSVAGGHDRLRGALVAGQIALGLVLLSGASLLIASFHHLTQRDPGFQPDHTLVFSVSLPGSLYNRDQQIRFYDRLIEQLRSVPGVQSAAGGGPLPLTGHEMTISFSIEERPTSGGRKPYSDMAIVTPGYFRTMGIPLLKGRDFIARDDLQTTQVLIVNKAFADRFFPGEDVIGKRMEPGATTGRGGTRMREIVGVVGNAKQAALTAPEDPIYYFPYKQLPWFLEAVELRTSVPPLSVESAARATVASIDPQVPVFRVRTMEELASTAITPARFLTLLLASFAAIALLLTVVGLYGVMVYSVTRREREIGVRIALGASRARVLSLVLKQALMLVAAGLVIGVAGALAAGRVLRGMLYGVSPRDPALLAIACVVVTATGILAAYLPARRAASTDPVEALRSE